MSPADVVLEIEVFSDVVCPWCYIGKRRLQRAAEVLGRGGDGEVPIALAVTPRAFQLDPTAPIGHPTPVIDVYSNKFGGPERAHAIIAQVTEVAAQDGLTFRLDRALRANTLLAHRLIWWSTQSTTEIDPSDVEERIMAAYFTDGLDIGSANTLTDLAVDAGAERTSVVEFFESTEGAAAVAAELAQAAELGITGVPTIVVGGTWGITGAQDVDTLVRLLRRYAHANQPGPSGADGEA